MNICIGRANRKISIQMERKLAEFQQFGRRVFLTPICCLRFLIMEVSSVSPRVPPRQLRSGMIFCAKSPTLGDKLLSNFPRGRGVAMGRGSFHAKVLVLFIKNGRLPLQLIKKNTAEMQEDFLRMFCSCVGYLQT